MLKFCWQAMVRSTVGPVKPANKPTLLTIYKVRAPTIPCFIKCSPHHTTLWSQCPTILYNCPTATAQVTAIPVVQATISHLTEEALHIHHGIRKSFLDFLKILYSTDYVAFSIKLCTYFPAALDTYQLADPPANQHNLPFFFSKNNIYSCKEDGRSRTTTFFANWWDHPDWLSSCNDVGLLKWTALMAFFSRTLDGLAFFKEDGQLRHYFCKQSWWDSLLQKGRSGRGL